MSKVILSICIPSYDRFWKLKKNIESITAAKSEEIEIVVIDNCSHSDADVLNNGDNRLKIYKRSKPVHPNENFKGAVELSSGEFVMVCLDKDFLDGRYLDDFVSVLKQTTSVTCGFCETNQRTKAFSVVSSPITKYAYINRHPSGYFAKKSIIMSEYDYMRIDDPMSSYYRNGFQFDFIMAACMKEGNLLIYSQPFLRTETPEEASRTKSYTYSKSGKNLFFLPKNRTSQLQLAKQHLTHLGLFGETREKVLSNIIKDYCYHCTIGYKNIMADANICSHYGIDARKISNRELREEMKLVVSNVGKMLDEQSYINSALLWCYYYYTLLKNDAVNFLLSKKDV